MPATPKKPASSRYKQVPGNRNKFVGPRGKEISRRDLENMKAKEVGFSSYAEYKKLRHDPTYTKFMAYGVMDAGREVREMRKLDSEFNRLYLKAQYGLKHRKGRAYKSPNSQVAKFLTYIGKRSEYDKHDVGDTP